MFGYLLYNLYIGDLKTYKKIPVFVHENHNEVLESIYRAIGSKHLPLHSNFLVHFDSHPDCCRPEHMPACYVADKELLFDAINIESWIIPAVYGGQIDRVAWVKPPWAPQIPAGQHKVIVGENDKEIFINSKLDYFITEGSYCNKEELRHKKTLTLDVLEIDQLPEFEDLVKYTFILDIDLDFFSTKNPFLEIYGDANAYTLLKEIYIIPKTYNVEDEDSIITFSKKRLEHIRNLESFFTHLDEGKTLESYQGECKENDKLLNFVATLKRTYSTNEIDWILVHNAGCTCDEIELPHHVSSRNEILELMVKFETFIRALRGPPTIITISRSSVDDYCPLDQVEFIQSKVLEVIEKVYHQTEVIFEYLKDD